jgi:SP family general alpha glucoside:H+ symporter-like MFS transporter
MLNPTSRDLRGKRSYAWGSTGAFCLVTAYFTLPESKDWSYREIDIMFRRRVPACQWAKYELSIEDDE